jgi:glycosyltransferase involved in cell wall biosynthesis
MARVICLTDQDEYFGGGERMLLRVAAIARRHAATDLGVLWGRGGGIGAAELSGFERIVRFNFPEPIGLRTWGAHRAAMRRLTGWAAEWRTTTLLAFTFRAAVRAAMIAVQLNIPMAWMCQQSDVLGAAFWRRPKGWMARRLLLRVQGEIVCINEAARWAFVAAGIPAARVHYIRNGVAVEHLAAAAMSAEQQQHWRATHRIPPGDLIVVCVARIDPNKQHDVLIEAVRAANTMGVRVVLVCVGTPNPGLESYESELRALTQRVGVAEQVVWPGRQSDVRDWLGMADVAVLASREEAGPLAFAEAGAMGLPLIGTRVGGIPEIIVPGETGLLFESGDVQACAAALVALARNPEQRRQLGRGAQALVRAHFNAALQDEAWAALLQRLAMPRSAE